MIGGRHLAQEHFTERAIFDAPPKRAFIRQEATHRFLLAKLRIDSPNMGAKRVLPLAQRAAGSLHLHGNNRGCSHGLSLPCPRSVCCCARPGVALTWINSMEPVRRFWHAQSILAWRGKRREGCQATVLQMHAADPSASGGQITLSRKRG